MSEALPLSRRLLAEALGTAVLVATVVGSGIMADRLAGGNQAVALLGNTIPTGAILVVLITILGPVSGAHFNPAVSLVFASRGELPWRDVPPYVVLQCLGGIAGTIVAHLMFDLAPLMIGTTARSGPSQWLAEAVATFTLVLTILGSGSSAGVPRPALGWGACDPANPKNRRRRCSMMAERIGPEGVTRVVIDTSPDLREQLIDADVDDIDAVFLTHEHADQTHGMDDLRSVVLKRRKRIPVYMNASTASDIMLRFGYCFQSPPGSDYPPILDRLSIEGFCKVQHAPNLRPGQRVVVEA